MKLQNYYELLMRLAVLPFIFIELKPFDFEKIVEPGAHCVFTKPAVVPFGTSPTNVASHE
jgi:hypothetical protein